MEEVNLNFLRKWLSDVPSVPSHYCRSISTYQEKKFFYPGTTLINLHDEYKMAAEAAGARVVSLAFFSNVCHDMNFSVFIPRKDQCDVCVSAKHGNIDRGTFEAHIQAKDAARARKSKDKEAASDKVSVWTMDLQAVLLCPKTKASGMYYKTKLKVHNFTLFNLHTKEGFCYTWDESEGNLSSEMFAHFLYKHFDKVLDGNTKITEIIIWSDGCGYQNRNSTVANALLHLSMERNVKIVQQFLVAGHTQMECDSMHSTIERKIVCDIFTHRDYAVIMASARTRPFPYQVDQDFMKLSGSYVISIRPGKKAGDPTVHELRALEYQSSGKINFKLNFLDDTEWKALPVRIQIPNERFEWVRVFSTRQPIKLTQYHIEPCFDVSYISPWKRVLTCSRISMQTSFDEYGKNRL